MRDEKRPIILAVSHCLLDPKVRAKGLSQHPEIKEKILKLAEKYNAKIKQLPCPEFLFLGEREPKTYDEYMKIAGFEKFCKKLAQDIIDKLKNNKDYYIIVVGIARSPSCAVFQVYDKNNNLRKGEGILIRFLQKELKAVFTPTPKILVWGFTEIDYHQIDDSINKIEEILESIS